MRVLLGLMWCLKVELSAAKFTSMSKKISRVIDEAMQESHYIRQEHPPVIRPKTCHVKLIGFSTIFRGKATGLAILWGEKWLVKYYWNMLMHDKFKCDWMSQQVISTISKMTLCSLRAFSNERIHS